MTSEERIFLSEVEGRLRHLALKLKPGWELGRISGEDAAEVCESAARDLRFRFDLY